MKNIKESVCLLLGCLLLFSGTIPCLYVTNLSRYMGIEFLQSTGLVLYSMLLMFGGGCLLMFGMSAVLMGLSMRLQRKSGRLCLKNQGVV